MNSLIIVFAFVMQALAGIQTYLYWFPAAAGKTPEGLADLSTNTIIGRLL